MTEPSDTAHDDPTPTGRLKAHHDRDRLLTLASIGIGKTLDGTPALSQQMLDGLQADGLIEVKPWGPVITVKGRAAVTAGWYRGEHERREAAQ